MAKNSSQTGAGGSGGQVIAPTSGGTPRAGQGRGIAGGSGGKKSSRHNPTYKDTTAEYIAVRKNDLHEISKFGWLEEGAGAGGMFFLSGGFWALFSLIVEHHDHLADYWAGESLCVLAMGFGAILVWLAHEHFKMRKDRIDDIFKAADADN